MIRWDWILQSHMIYVTEKLKLNVCLVFKPLHFRILKLYVKGLSYGSITVQNIELLIYLYYYSVSSDICW